MRWRLMWVCVGAVCGGAVGCSERAATAPVVNKSSTAVTTVAGLGSEVEEVTEAEEVALVSQARRLMGSVFRISVEAPEEIAAPAMRRALDAVAQLEARLSEWQDTSEISQINTRAGQQPMRVHEDTWRVVRAGLDVSRWSGGAFDISWAVLHGLYDFRPGHHRVPTTQQLRRQLPLIDWQMILTDAQAHTVFLQKPGMKLGTGGIAKGYALDRAGAILRDAGIDNYMLFGGGQVQVHGLRQGRPWRVGILHPRRQDYFAAMEVTDVSMSTSGDYEHAFYDRQGNHWHHILDLSTGRPVHHTRSVTVLAPSGLYADALSTAAFVLGAERAIAMFATLPFHAEAVIVDADCRLHSTPGTRERLRITMPLRANTHTHTDDQLQHCEP